MPYSYSQYLNALPAFYLKCFFDLPVLFILGFFYLNTKISDRTIGDLLVSSPVG